jgi:hypothetical protein
MWKRMIFGRLVGACLAAMLATACGGTTVSSGGGGQSKDDAGPCGGCEAGFSCCSPTSPTVYGCFQGTSCPP